MQYPSTFRIFMIFAATLWLSSCTQTSETRGTLALIEGQTQLIEDEQEQKALCASHFCEPNYVVYASFGRRRSPPTPIAPTPPTPPWVQPSPSFPNTYAPALMGVETAWKRTRGSPGVTVAVIDSGADLAHPALQKKSSINSAELKGRPGVDDDQNGLTDDIHGYDFSSNVGNPRDDSGHGTHVAGIVLQVAPEVRILHLKFIDGSGSGTTYNAIRAIDYAISRGVSVINASWGGSAYSQLLDQAIQRAIRAGIQFVAAAGNEGLNVDFSPRYPARIQNVISVAASDSRDQLTTYSNFGQSVSITAPGDKILSSVVGGGSDELSGTSMASPQVAGAIALLKSVRPSPQTPEILEHLCKTAKTDRFRGSRCGRIDVGQSVLQW